MYIPIRGSSGGGSFPVFQVMDPYVKNTQLFACPSRPANVIGYTYNFVLGGGSAPRNSSQVPMRPRRRRTLMRRGRRIACSR